MKYQSYAAVAVLAALGACGGGGTDSVSPQSAAATAPCTLELNGDSILDSPGIVRPAIRLAAARPLWQIEDDSLGGLPLRELIAGNPSRHVEPYAAKQHSAEFVVIENGGADALQERSTIDYEADLRWTIDHVRGRGAVPILTGIVVIPVGELFTAPRVQRRAELNAIVRMVAQQEALPYAGWDTAEFAGLSETIDTVHRTQPASDRLVAKLVATLDALAPQCSAAQ